MGLDSALIQVLKPKIHKQFNFKLGGENLDWGLSV